MSSTCLSSVLTHANLTMYHTGISDVLPQQLNAFSPAYSCSINTAGQWYKQTSPHCWTPENVLEWISDHVESTKFDASTLSLDCCTMDGSALCQLSQEQMIGVFGPQLGPHLHHNLQEHKTKYELQSLSGPELNETCQLLDNFLHNLSFQTFQNFPLLSTVRIGIDEEPVHKREVVYSEDLSTFTVGLVKPLQEDYLSDNQSDSEYSSSSNSLLCGFSGHSSPESASGESEPEFSYPLDPKVHIKTEKGEARLKRPRGRPPKANREQSSSGGVYDSPKKNKHVPRGTHLWEFIRDILIHPEKNQGLMKWEDRREGVFKFLKSEAVAQMWGQKKKNNSMTYEKLSRAMRYYYKREILERVDGRRLVYKFGRNSTGWKVEELGVKV